MNFYVRLGMFMAAWQFIEAGLGSIYLVCLKIPSDRYESAKAAFYRCSDFNTRLEMTADAVKYSDLQENLKTEWASLKKQLKSCCENRNKIAHGVVYWAPYEEEFGDKEMFVEDNLDNPKYKAKSKKFYFSDLEDMTIDFDKKSDLLNDFLQKIIP